MRLEDLEAALVEGMRLHLAELDAIASSTDPATFENTIVAMERGEALIASSPTTNLEQ